VTAISWKKASSHSLAITKDTTNRDREKSSGQTTDKNENQISLICKEIQNGVVAKSYMTNGLLIYGEIFPHFLIN
jgi:hypothetical protein